MKKIVVSLCDGMSCGAIALDRLGLMTDKDVEYHAFEIDKYAEAVSRYNYPEIIRHGDAREYTKLIGKDVFLLMGGFPCQPYSVAGQGKGDNDERDLSTLIVDALRDLKPKYFLFENVPMKQEHQDRISAELGVEPVLINSQDFSAHHRKRLYWTNIPVAPYKDKGIVLSDIIEDGMVDRDKSYCIDANYFKGGSMKMYYEKSRRQLVFRNTKDEQKWRNLTPKECERLQTVPDGYTEFGVFVTDPTGITPKRAFIPNEWQQDYEDNWDIIHTHKTISNSQRYKMLGNGWTVDVIQHIMEGMEV
jgi:site-specific DNA-cytosine methylase